MVISVSVRVIYEVSSFAFGGWSALDVLLVDCGETFRFR